MAVESQEKQNHSYGIDDDDDDDTDGCNGLRYLIVRPEKGGIRDLFRYTVLADIDCGVRFLESSDEKVVGRVAADHRWVIVVSLIVRKIIAVFGKPLEWTGYVVDFILNLLSLNGDFTGLLFNLLRGKVVVPQRGSETFISTIGHIDGRIDLYKGKSEGDVDFNGSVSEETRLRVELGNRALMDLCIMASKLAYENAKVIRNVMHFVDFYDCWNDFQKEMSTQIFILCDKPKDANLILVSFRGTEPFDADDWSTDFDYSWYEIPEMGKVHMGFLEALGLGNRTKAATFQNHLLPVKNTKFTLSEGTKSLSSNSDMGQGRSKLDQSSASGESFITGGKMIPPEMVEKTAYYVVRSTLKSLLEEHKNAKFVVTGHSLGGALAILFPTVLVLHEETEMIGRLLGVYTFGQPRIGNRQLGGFMEKHLRYPVPKYFRVVYCNDLVPRLPYDDKTFLYKHFGRMVEEPNRNFYGITYLIPEYLNAVWELIRSLTMGYTYGPEYKEGWFSKMARLLGLALPGISAHCPTDYVNSVRLGQERNSQTFE
ncbi:hypothetical protein FEM48_Zijuj01G0258700 [Ziziphus jujuba var. spinosa]|uniref:Fungal lipase-type domain-containing protein n=1 Tax=Ziziphus jujuba var. spinosa TaxID=714518 RepID=A0A978W4U7_ZIZJJ|nr:hypothetical protein FEM48_Zijuj01G0258700 [Ziziphus jujuba var. spinosa]